MSKVPIICICNDRQSPKIKSLANSCFDLKVKRPTKQQIAKRLVEIAQREGMFLEANAAEVLVEQVGNDIRQAINTLQMWRTTGSRISYTDMKGRLDRIEKDKVLRQSPFEACLHILAGSKTPVDERFNEFFIDYSLLPLLVAQNYIDSSKNGIFKAPGLGDAEKLNRLSQAADSVSDLDMVGAAIRGQDMSWSLLPNQAMMAVRTGFYVQGFQAFPTFPAWLGKNSTFGKKSRLTKEISNHTALSIGQGFTPIRLDYIPYLRDVLVRKMLSQDADAVSSVVAMLDEYGLSKDDFMETMKEFQFLVENDKSKGGVFEDRFAKIESKVKAALTRAYNGTAHTSQALTVPLVKPKKNSGGGGGGSSGGGDTKMMDEEGNVLEEDVEEEEAEEGSDDEVDFKMLLKKPKSKQPSAAAKKPRAKKGS